MPNSLLAGKIQGISSIRSLAVPGRQRKGARNQFLTGQFPTHPNREFFSALQGIKSGDQGSFRRDQGIPLSSAILAFAPGDKSDRPDRFPTLPRRRKRRHQMLEVAEADLDAGICPCERRAGHGGNRSPNSSTRTIGVPGWHRSRRAPPAEPSSTVAGGPRVRIHLPPAGSLLRTATSSPRAGLPARAAPPLYSCPSVALGLAAGGRVARLPDSGAARSERRGGSHEFSALERLHVSGG
jgi:hypothetical protein